MKQIREVCKYTGTTMNIRLDDIQSEELAIMTVGLREYMDSLNSQEMKDKVKSVIKVLELESPVVKKV